MPENGSLSDSNRQTAAAKPAPVKAFSSSDLATLVGLPVLLAVSWLVPERLWRGFCRAVGPLAVPMLAGDPRAAVELIGRTLGPDRLAASPAAILQEVAGEHILSILQLLRDYRPGGWRPEIRLAGLEHVEAALERGNGVVLWVVFSVHGDLVAKMAFHRAGLAVSHLSRASHGFSTTRFGMRFLNRVQRAVEDRYLGARVMLATSDAKAALTVLAERLAENRVVTFTVHRNAKRPVVAPFLDGQITLAPGAMVLAQKTGAALLPAFAFRDEAGVLRVTVEPPLEAHEGASRQEAVEDTARQYAALLEPYVLRCPGQWKGWLHL